jgi:hypothetical protein
VLASRRPANKIGWTFLATGLLLSGVHSWTFRKMERMLSFLDIGTMASEDRCREGGHSSGRLSESS